MVGGSHWDVPNNVKIYDGPDSFSVLMGILLRLDLVEATLESFFGVLECKKLMGIGS